MDFTLDELKSAMIIQTKKNDIVSNNIANANTIGFKRDYTFFNTFRKKIEEVNNLSVHTVKDFSQGEFETTNNPLDLSISGEGFFTIEMNGEKVYTRNGHFDLDNDGYLIDGGGNFVLGEQGKINLLSNYDQISNMFISGEGEIIVDDIMMDKLLVSNFSDKTQLERLSGSVFRVNNPQASETIENNAVILQGKIEQSNVNPISEMVNLMELQRGFESSQRTIKILDGMLSKAATQLSKV